MKSKLAAASTATTYSKNYSERISDFFKNNELKIRLVLTIIAVGFIIAGYNSSNGLMIGLYITGGVIFTITYIDYIMKFLYELLVFCSKLTFMST